MGRPRTTYWYAVKVFHNRVDKIREEFRSDRYETYYPFLVEEKIDNGGIQYVEKPVMNSLLFVRCPEKYLINFKDSHESEMLFYTGPGSRLPGRIDDMEMEMFKAATSVMDKDTIFLGSDTSKYCVGDKVVVTEGIYKGLEGYVKRIRHARKVLVSIRGIAVVALSNIHPQYLRKI